MRWSITSTMQSCIDTRMMSLSRRCKELCGMSRHSRMETWKGETSWWTWKGSAITSASATKVRLVISTLVMHDKPASSPWQMTWGALLGRRFGISIIAVLCSTGTCLILRQRSSALTARSGEWFLASTASAVRLVNAISARLSIPMPSTERSNYIRPLGTSTDQPKEQTSQDEADSDRSYKEPRSGQTNRFGCEEG